MRKKGAKTSAAQSHLVIDGAIAALIVAISLLVFRRAMYADFISYDDPQTITQNPAVFNGITAEGLWYALTAIVVANWHPVTVLSHQVVAHLFGLNPAAHHFANVILHIVNAVVLYRLLVRMTEIEWPGQPLPRVASAFAALLFAVHPAHVESVAWITERKDVLSTLFWLLTTWVYVDYARSRGGARYAVMGVLFALGLMSKAMLVTLPFTLLLFDYWPLRRLSFVNTPPTHWRRTAWPLIREKLPLFALCIAFSAITLVTQEKTEAIVGMESTPPAERVAHIAVSYVWYLAKLAWPTNLAIFYPYDSADYPWWKGALALAVLAAITAVALRLMSRHPYLIVGWLWYVGTLVPVIGIVKVGYQAVADRYTYVPSIGVFIAVVFGAAILARRTKLPPPAVVAAGALVVLLLSLRAWAQVGVWRDSETLFMHALKVEPNNAVAHTSLALVYEDAGRIDLAHQHYAAAAKIKPNDPRIYMNWGGLTLVYGDPNDAATLYRRALELTPDNARAHANLAAALLLAGNPDEARNHVQRSLALEPGNDAALQVLAELDKKT